MKLNILNSEETIIKIKEGYSICRFGDGEFYIILMRKRDIKGIQTYSDILRQKLLFILHNPTPNLLIGIPTEEYKERITFVKKFHRDFIKYHKPNDTNFIYASAYFTRPDCTKKLNEKYFNLVRSIWDNKNVVLVNFNSELKKFKLFSNCNTIEFVEIPRRDCFFEYENILNECKKYFKKGYIFLLSCGPTATVLSHDINVRGEIAIDIGQISLCYSLFIKEDGLKWTSQNAYRLNFRGNK